MNSLQESNTFNRILRTMHSIEWNIFNLINQYRIYPLN